MTRKLGLISDAQREMEMELRGERIRGTDVPYVRKATGVATLLMSWGLMDPEVRFEETIAAALAVPLARRKPTTFPVAAISSRFGMDVAGIVTEVTSVFNVHVGQRHDFIGSTLLSREAREILRSMLYVQLNGTHRTRDADKHHLSRRKWGRVLGERWPDGGRLTNGLVSALQGVFPVDIYDSQPREHIVRL